ncbi:PREDICTED: GPI-anchored protein LORELEI [Fragaria vesca subsp. vesca]|uniref:GPI-anchored protein LORELEI n=1 Tax=Fragaria vesca subsp. vesca TaxID=101020 RepID=UPI0002C358E2|nr:PREDICTED: GPI-anchored protein LORELEI [Fragaria vesca subsp. vesca]XP_011461553.1 PREDICTED: GPI-anchored protein LORELEI [Fragaria vesca subsp. vesca]
MVLNQSFSFCFATLIFFVLLGLPASSSSSPTFISDGIFESQASIGRNLLQAKKGCPVNFEFLNYTIITSQCKGPRYPADPCCASFKELACPYTDVLNDLTNECASIMFSYINLYGNYPPGLFANECREGKLGLECPALPPSTVADDVNGVHTTSSPSPLLMLTSGFLLLLFRLL